jgi:hypothetical protein
VLFVRPTRRCVDGVFEELSRLLRRHRTRSGVADRSACLLPCVFLVLSLMVWLFSFFSSKMLRFLPGLLEKARYNLAEVLWQSASHNRPHCNMFPEDVLWRRNNRTSLEHRVTQTCPLFSHRGQGWAGGASRNHPLWLGLPSLTGVAGVFEEPSRLPRRHRTCCVVWLFAVCLLARLFGWYGSPFSPLSLFLKVLSMPPDPLEKDNTR